MTEAAKHLRTMLENEDPYDEAAQRIKKSEREADRLAHRSIETPHKTFVTPLDLQDILRLGVGLGDILDTIEISDHQQSWGYEVDPSKGPGPRSAAGR